MKIEVILISVLNMIKRRFQILKDEHINNTLNEEITPKISENYQEEIDTPEPNLKLDASPEAQAELFKNTLSPQLESTQECHLLIENEDHLLNLFENNEENKEEIILEHRNYSQGSVKGKE